MDGPDSYSGRNYQHNSVSLTPKGLEAIYSACRQIYTDQPNPLQVAAILKYWLNGPDPLDYISMYANPGSPDQGIPPHWHYVSFGLTDLHGDNRVHEYAGPDGISGFGFELTFRLKRETDETCPPTWPAALMQSLARYVFKSENTLCVGDHIPWHSPLDGSDSRIQHMLMVEDPQLPPISTPFGAVQFVQIVGVCEEELRAAQHWNGIGVADLLRSIPVAGGPWLITDARRGETMYDIDPTLQERIERGIDFDGSNLSGVTSRCGWEAVPYIGNEHSHNEDEVTHSDRHNNYTAGDTNDISQTERDEITRTLKQGLIHSHSRPREETDNHHYNTDHNRNRSRKQSFDSNISSDAPTELLRTRTLDNLHLHLNPEAASLLPLALKGRLRHGRHFTYKSTNSEMAITLVTSRVEGTICTERHPYAAHGPWLQVLLTDDQVEKISSDLQHLTQPDIVFQVPQMYRWPEMRLQLSIIPDHL